MKSLGFRCSIDPVLVTSLWSRSCNLDIGSDRLSWDTKDSKLKIKSTSRIQRIVDTWWNFWEVSNAFLPANQWISELAFAGNSELSQASNALSRKSPSFSRLHIVYGGRVCLSKTRAAYVLRRAPRIGKRHRRRISIQMFFTRDGLRWEDSRTWRHHQTFRKWTSRHIEPGRYGDSRGTLKKLQKRTTKHSSVWTERSGVMQLPRLPSTAKPQELKLCEDRHKLSFHTSLSPARWVQRITIWYPLVN